MHIPFSLTDLSTEVRFTALQRKFFCLDERLGPPDWDEFELKKGDFTIVVKKVNDMTFEEDYIEISFWNDCLLPQIRHLAKRYIQSFKRALENGYILEERPIELFARKHMKVLMEQKQMISNADFLSKRLRVEIANQIDIAEDYLHNVHINPNYSDDDKIKFKLNKTDLLLLFLLLREAGYIDHPYDNDFGGLLDNTLLYKDERDGSYKSVSHSRKVLNDFKNGNRGTEKALNRLKEIFSQEQLYRFPK